MPLLLLPPPIFISKVRVVYALHSKKVNDKWNETKSETIALIKYVINLDIILK